MSLIENEAEFCRCENPNGKSQCADCESRITLAEKAGMTFSGYDAERRPEFIGTEAQWAKFDKLVEDKLFQSIPVEEFVTF